MRYFIVIVTFLITTAFLGQCQQKHNVGKSVLQKKGVMPMEEEQDTSRRNMMMGPMHKDRKREKKRSLGQGMRRQMMTDVIPSGVNPDELPDRDSRGAKLFVRNCMDCHELPSPAMLSAGEWPEVSRRMFRRMNMKRGMMRATISHEEEQAIISYLKKHALASASEDQFASEQSRGAQLFKEICAQCHALPDPQTYSLQEWERIIERMQNHMEKMNKGE